MTQTCDPEAFVRPAVAADYATVLVPLDGSERAEAALGPARGLAARFGADLHTITGAIRRDERWWYDRYLDGLQAADDGLVTHRSADPGVPDGIVAAARDLAPCLVCMATRGRSRRAAVLGSTFSQVVAAIGEPVLAVGPRLATRRDASLPDRLVACLDGAPESEQALPVAAAWARRFGARLTLLTAADPLVVRRWTGHEPTKDVRNYLPSGDPYTYLATVAGLPLFDGLVVDRAVLWGLAEPAVVIGERFDLHPPTLAAAATHARTGLARAALGSTAARIVHRSPVPVLVVPASPGP